MKKTLCILLALLMVFSFAACGNSGKDQGNKPSEADEVKLTRGTWNEAQTEFVNESTGIKITLPSGYAVMGDKELVENYAAGSISIFRHGLKKATKQRSTFLIQLL